MKKINIIFAAILVIFLAVFIGQKDVKDIFAAKTSGENYTGNFKLEANRQIYQKFKFLSDDIENIQIGISDAKASSDALEGGVILYLCKSSGQTVYQEKLDVNSDKTEYSFNIPNSVSKEEEYILSLKYDTNNENNALNIKHDINKDTDKEILDDGTLEIYQKSLLISSGYVRCIIVGAAISVILICGGIFLCRKIGFEAKCILVVAFIGFIYLFVLPPKAVPDEENHFLRIFEITQGNFVSEKEPITGEGGNYLPEGLDFLPLFEKGYGFDEYSMLSSQKINYDKEVWYSFENTSLYSPLSYLPQIVGVIFGKLITGNPVYIAALGRAFGFLFSLAALWFSMKYIPTKKYILPMIALIPMYMQEAVSLSADSFTNSLVMIFVSYVFYLAYADIEQINIKQIAFVFIVSGLIALSKIVYLPICFIIFIVPKEKFKNIKHELIFKLSAAAAIFLNILWLTVSWQYLCEFRESVNSNAQMKYIMLNPIEYSAMAVKTFYTKADALLFEMFGSLLGWLNISVPSFFILILIFIMFAVIFFNGGSNLKVRKKDIYFICALEFIITALIFTSLYVQWTPYLINDIYGLQGRYFLPCYIAALSFLVCAYRSSKGSEDKSSKEPIFFSTVNKYAFAYLIFLNLIAIIAIAGFRSLQ